MASVATMTGTLIDSGCKHIIPTKVSMDTLLDINAGQDQNMLLRDKMRFSVHRMDLLLCVNKAIFRESNGALTKNAAYPHVVSTLGDVSEQVQHFIAKFYHEPHKFMGADGHFDSGLIREVMVSALTADDLKCIKRVPFFSFMGFSLGLGYAHPSSGDTVVSSMIGGMLSVQNGHFSVCTGDLIMWYFEFEESLFDAAGRRRANAGQQVLTEGAGQRRQMHRKENGVYEKGAPRERNKGKTNIAYPKPFLRLCAVPSSDTANLGALDASRVFAKAVSNARPFDKLDIMICTQSI